MKNNEVTTNEDNVITSNLAEVNDKSRGTYNASNQIKIKISLIRSNLCYYSDKYINVNRQSTHWNSSGPK